MLRPLTRYCIFSSWMLLFACNDSSLHESRSQTKVYSKSPATTNLSDLSPVSSVVALLKGGLSNCSGVAVSKGYVLTAAHCVSNCGTSGSYECRVNGAYEDYLIKDRLDNEYGIEKIVLPKKVHMINNTIVEGADVALVQLKSNYRLQTAPLTTKERAEIIFDDNTDRLESPSNTLITAGFGVFDDMNKPVWLDGKLRAAVVPFRYYSGILGNDEILAGSTKVHAANGDSGGPLLVDDGSGQFKTVGITSRKITVDGMNTFDTDGILYANLTQEALHAWILGEMKANGGDMTQNMESEDPNGEANPDGTEIASFSSLMPTDTRQFRVPTAKDGWIDIRVKNRAIELHLIDPSGQEIKAVKIAEGTLVRVDLKFSMAGLHRLNFKETSCLTCQAGRIESINIYTK